MAEQSIPRRFQGRTVLVTGAGTGYGAEIAVRAAQEGAQVAVHYRNSHAGADNTVTRIKDAGGEAFTLQADITVHTDVIRMAEEVFHRFGTLDALVNNVGRTPPTASDAPSGMSATASTTPQHTLSIGELPFSRLRREVRTTSRRRQRGWRR